MSKRLFTLQDAAKEPARPLQLKVLWRRYIIALGLILSVLFISHVLAQADLLRSTRDGSAISLSGQQSTLLQRISHAAHDYAEQPDDAHKAELQVTLSQFERLHERLKEISTRDKMLHDLYTDGTPSLDELIMHLTANTYLVLAAPMAAESSLAQIEAAANGLLATRLDNTVNAFETTARMRSDQLRRTQEFSLLIAFLTVIGEVLFIFWPAQKTIASAFAQLHDRQKTTEAALSRLSNFAGLAADLFWETDTNGHIIYAEGKFLKQLKGGRDSLIGCQYLDIVQIDKGHFARMRKAHANGDAYTSAHALFTDSDGQTYNIEISGMPRYDESGEFAGYLGVVNDVTAVTLERQKALKLANTDPLTGLANMRRFESKMPDIIAEARAEAPAYLLALDLDGFKAVNDTYGHGAGDEVLKFVTTQMKSIIREDDLAVRSGGDEFLIVLKTVPNRDVVEQLARRLNRQLSAPLVLSIGRKVRVSASIGAASAPFDATDLKTLTKAADTALYAAKRAGRNRTCFFEDLATHTQDAIAS
jgi:diguanylate cyclase (GGDEF)-like protein/PAS domain S-box-containing protein